MPRGAWLGLALAAVAGAQPRPAWEYRGYQLAGDIRSSGAWDVRNRAAADGRAHLTLSPGRRLPWGAFQANGRWLDAGPHARERHHVRRIQEPSAPPPVAAEEIVDRSTDGRASLFRFAPEDTRSRTPWVFRVAPEAEDVELPLPPGVEPDDTQVRLCPDASCAVMLYREPASRSPRRTGIWVPRLDASRSEFRRELAGHGPHAPGAVHQWVGGHRTDPLELVAAADGAAWVATQDGMLLFVGPTGHLRTQLRAPGRRPIWSARDAQNWAALIPDTTGQGPLVHWVRKGRRLDHRFTLARIADLSFGLDHLAVSLTTGSNRGRVEVLSLEDGRLVEELVVSDKARIQLLGKHLLLVEDYSGVEVYRLPGRTPPKPVPGTRGSIRQLAEESGGVPWAFLALLGAVAYISWRWSPYRIELATVDGQTVTPSRPADAPVVDDEPADAEGIEFLVSDAFPPEATELLATFLYLRAADELRAGQRLDGGIFEELRRRARLRTLPLWEGVFPGAAPAVHAWLLPRLGLLDEHLVPAAREALRTRIEEAAAGASGEPPDGRLAQLYKLHLLFIAATEAAGGAAELTELRGHVFDQALAVLRELQAERALPPGFATAVRDRARETLGALDPAGEIPAPEEAELDRRFAEAIAAFLEVEAPTCRVCGDALAELPVTSCGDCDTPHHRDCWDFNQGCAVFACGGTESAAPLEGG